MMAGSDAAGGTGGSGGDPRHIPVLLSEVIEALAPKDGETYIDGTFGAGGYSRAILGAADCRVLALDRDPAAVAGAAPLVARYGGRLRLVEAPFAMLDAVAREGLAVAIEAKVQSRARVLTPPPTPPLRGGGNGGEGREVDQRGGRGEAGDLTSVEDGGEAQAGSGGGAGGLGEQENGAETRRSDARGGRGEAGDLTSVEDGGEALQVDGVVLDIGVSSMQIDEPARGFSFLADGPLDMRMSGAGISAADIVNTHEEADLADILFHLGEEKRSRAIARAICRARDEAAITTTRGLAQVVEKAIGRRPGDDKHPATRTFQALRIHVNDELGQLAAGLLAAERALKPSGRLVVVTFHSLEDRIVKRFLQRRAGRLPAQSRHAPAVRAAPPAPSFQIVNQQPLTPSQRELAANPRARSAKLRAAVRTEAPVFAPEDMAELGIPRLRETRRR